jgi:DNA-binding MarR family transcriptional regulator
MDLVPSPLVGPRASSAAREAWQCVAELLMSQEVQHRFLAAAEASDLSPPQLKALLSLEPGVSQSMRALAEGWRCDASWVTGIVDGLEERGYVQRQPHATDRRVKEVVLTPLGEKAKASVLERLYEPPASFSALTPAEQAQLRDLLMKARPARR